MPPKSKVLKLSREDETRLVHEVRKRPILWDISLTEYSRSDLKPSIWDEVGRVIGHPGEGDVIQHRFKNMRDTFMSNYRKVKESKRSGMSATDVYVPKWYLYKELEFLEKTCAQAQSTSNISMQSGPSTSNSSQTTVLEMELESFNPGNSMYYDQNTLKFMMIPSDVQTFSETPSEISMQSDVSEVLSSPNSPDLFVPPRPASAPSATTAASKNVKRKQESDEEDMYRKRGHTKKTGAAILEEAVSVLQGNLCQKYQLQILWMHFLPLLHLDCVL
ncbi:Transcription factor Adf-1 [Frankliniella fusca]|uniref:Transcription factor Adf-1 n=1 Tax=Frankliniella fusca TaxID=407009 RepID=A0AAE1GYA7_9NEOP|nr:Transcription factor Adf-1 [Frankliniella fusca]